MLMKKVPELPQTIDECRAGIDEADLAILQKLLKRMLYVGRIGKLKKEKGTAVIDQNREEEIYQRLIKAAEDLGGVLREEDIREIFGVIISVSRKTQQRMREDEQ